jgi:hypothetical protein
LNESVLLGRVKEFRDYSPVFPHAREGLLPIDAKFPHDSFERVVATAKAGNLAEDFFARAEIHLTFFKLYQGWNEAQMIVGAMAVWTSLEPQLTTPTPQPLPTRRRGAH